jgi:hypothetical protein
VRYAEQAERYTHGQSHPRFYPGVLKHAQNDDEDAQYQINQYHQIHSALLIIDKLFY